MKRPRILFLSPRFPFPLNSGTPIRINHLLQGVAQVGDVDLVCYGAPHALDDDLLDNPDAMPSWWRNLRSVQVLPRPRWHAADPPLYQRRLSMRLLSSSGLCYDSFPSAPMQKLAAQLAARVDLIWAERLYVALGFKQFADKVVVDLDDLESVKLSREAQTEPHVYMRWALRREAARLANMERAAVRQFSRVAVCSPEDARFFGSSADRVWVMPNGVDDALTEKPAIPRVRHRLVFVGTLSYTPNEDALLYFCREILPLVLAQVPDVSLSIVGLKPPPSILALQDGQRIFVHANVPEVAPYVQEATASIVPLRVGGGTRLKILESLALGTPVVSTTVGAEGLDLRHGEHLLLADSPKDFAESVVGVLRDADLHERLAVGGRNRVKQSYLWSSLRNQVAAQCEALLRGKPKRHPEPVGVAADVTA